MPLRLNSAVLRAGFTPPPSPVKTGYARLMEVLGRLCDMTQCKQDDEDERLDRISVLVRGTVYRVALADLDRLEAAGLVSLAHGPEHLHVTSDGRYWREEWDRKGRRKPGQEDAE